MHFDLHGAIGLTPCQARPTCRDLLGDEALAFDLLAGLSEKSTEPSRALARLADLANRCRPCGDELSSGPRST
jgi:hypothetical protein